MNMTTSPPVVGLAGTFSPMRWCLSMVLVCVSFVPVSRGTPPNAPDHLTVTGAFCATGGENSVNLNWNDNSDNDAGFVVQASTDGGHTWNSVAYAPNGYITLHSNSSMSAIGYYSGGIQPNTTTSFRVAATHPTLGVSAFSNEASITMGSAPGPGCTTPLALPELPNMKAHVGFPIDLRIRVNRTSCATGLSFCVVSGPPGLKIDFSGGLVTWTPTQYGSFPVTLGFGTGNSAHVCDPPSNAVVTTSFTIDVDAFTISQPLFRDYRSEATQIPIIGGFPSDFSFYSFYSSELCSTYSGDSCPNSVVSTPASGPLFAPAQLATWDISGYANGSRRLLTMITQSPTGQNSALYDPVIIDRSAFNANWPKRIPLGSPRGALAVDVDGDGSDAEIIANSRDPVDGGPYCWDLSGSLRWKAVGAGEVTASEVAVGDINGTGKNDVVTVSAHHLRVLDGADGSVIGHVDVTNPTQFLSGASLANLNSDANLEILVNVGDGTNPAQTYAYKWDPNVNNKLSVIPYFPKVLTSPSATAPPATADLDGDGKLDIIVDNRTTIWAWSGASVKFFSLFQTTLPYATAYPDAQSTNGGTNILGFAQPSIADLDNDGSLEVVVGQNVLSSTGSYLRCLGATPCSGISGAKGQSASIGEFDATSSGPEILLAGRVFSSSTGALLRTFPGFYPGPTTLIDGGVDGQNQPRTYAVFSSGVNQFDSSVSAYHSDGTLDAPEYPKALYGTTMDGSAPQAGDFNGDGNEDVLVEVTDSSYGAIVALYQDDGEVPFNPLNNPWPMAGHDPQRTGRNTCKQQRESCSGPAECCSGKCSTTCR